MNNPMSASDSISNVRPKFGFARTALLASASLLLPVSAFAQDKPPVPADDSEASDAAAREIVVTGSRIVRDGYNSPTPVTVVGQAEINAKAPQNVADLVNELPAVAGSLTPRNTVSSPAFSLTGLNAINLRGLDIVGSATAGGNFTRTLVLLDGHRTVPANVNGVVDVNNFPQQLIKRIDIVTGGASSAYGSDAVAGVVNFVLDHEFTGLKAEAQAGVTTHGDGRNWRAAVSGGFRFGNDRGHVLLSGEIARSDGIVGIPRDWAEKGVFGVPNPAYVPGNGEPQYIVTSQVALNNVTYGGIITTTALRGTAFGPGGTPYQFNYGTPAGSFSIGGDWQSNQFMDVPSLDPKERRENLFGRVSYEITDDIEFFGLVNYGNSEYPAQLFPEFRFDILIKADNPFIPASVAAQMTAQGITSFRMGSMNGDLPAVRTQQGRSVQRYQAGLNGSFEALSGNWAWDLFYERGIAKEKDRSQMLFVGAYLLATDAVLHPTTGAIVCRSTLTDPTNGCVPYNPMGTGVNSQAAIDYLIGENDFDLSFKQNIFAANLRGEPFSTWAGPVSIALGAEYRDEKVDSQTNPIAKANGWIGSNYGEVRGERDVKEVYLETVIPLIKDAPVAESLDLNGAVRLTDYSTSGRVVTWKLGVTYSPIPDIRFRVTRSRDIRAPNIRELFGGVGTTGTGGITNPFNNNQSETIALTYGAGNPNLNPEVADTIGLGVVLAPSFIPGLTTSIDYYRIKIRDAIGSTDLQTIVDRCFAGDQNFCSAITRNGNAITAVFVAPLNFVQQKAQGIDFDITYRRPMLNGTVMFHGLASHYLERSTTDLIGTVDYVGVQPRDWIYRATLTYDQEAFAINLTGRGFSDGLIAANYVACSTGCPLSTPTATTINTNRAPGAFYMDITFTYRFLREGSSHGAELFFAVSNIFDKDPAIYGVGGSGVGSVLAPFVTPANAGIYDVLGRVFRIGARFRM